MSKEPRGNHKDTSLQGALAVEAHHLRIILREISQRFIGDLESQVVSIIEKAGELSSKPEHKQALETVLEEMQALEVKPYKGRMGDLKRIRNLVKDTNRKLDELL